MGLVFGPARRTYVEPSGVAYDASVTPTTEHDHSDSPPPPAIRRVFLRFLGANAIGWLAFMAVVATGGVVPFFAVPLVFAAATGWAAGILTDRIAGRIGFGIATALGLVGSMFGMIGTQAMTGHESLLQLLPMLWPVVALNAVAAGVGLMPLGEGLGAKSWGFGVLGFAAGALVGGTMALVAMLAPWEMTPPLAYVLAIPFGIPMWLPSICGALAVAATARK